MIQVKQILTELLSPANLEKNNVIEFLLSDYGFIPVQAFADQLFDDKNDNSLLR